MPSASCVQRRWSALRCALQLVANDENWHGGELAVSHLGRSRTDAADSLEPATRPCRHVIEQRTFTNPTRLCAAYLRPALLDDVFVVTISTVCRVRLHGDALFARALLQEEVT